MKQGLFTILLLVAFNSISQTTIKINLTLKDTSFYKFANYWGMAYQFIDQTDTNYITLNPKMGRIYDMGGGKCHPNYKLKKNLPDANYKIYVDSFLTETFTLKDNAILGEHVRIRYEYIQKGFACFSWNEETYTYKDCNRRKHEFNVAIYTEELFPSDSIRNIDKKVIRSLSRDSWANKVMRESNFQKAMKQELAKKTNRKIISELQLNP